MAGHSKWANIQHRKKAQDAKRGKLFTKLIREITVAARAGDSVDFNPTLRSAVDKALTANMSRDTIDKAIKRGAGAGEGDAFESVRYEGYGPGGVAIMVDCLTDNRNRTVADVRHLFSKHGGNLGTDGSVAYLFSPIGLLLVEPGADEEQVFEAAIDAGADEVEPREDGGIEVVTAVESFEATRQALADLGCTFEAAELTQRPSVYVDLDHDDSLRVLKLMEGLEDLDDVQQVYGNAEYAEQALAEFA